MLDLSDQQMLLVKNILQKYIPNKEVWAFGSRVNGTAKKFSDLDLAIICSEKLPKKLIVSLEEAFDESDLPIKVDIVEFNNSSENFQEIIKSNYEVIKR